MSTLRTIYITATRQQALRTVVINRGPAGTGGGGGSADTWTDVTFTFTDPSPAGATFERTVASVSIGDLMAADYAAAAGIEWVMGELAPLVDATVTWPSSYSTGIEGLLSRIAADAYDMAASVYHHPPTLESLGGAPAAKFIAGAGTLTGPASNLTIGTAAGAAIGDFAPADISGYSVSYASTAGTTSQLFNGTIGGTLTINSTSITIHADAKAPFLTALGGTATGQSIFTAATVAAANAVLGVTKKTLTADEPGITSSTTFVIANPLTVALEANTTYKIDFYFLVTANGGNFKAEIRMPSVSGLTTQTNVGWQIQPGGTSVIGLVSGVFPITGFTSSPTGSHYQGSVTIATGATAGNLTVYWAQAPSSPNTTVLKARSSIRIEKL